MDNTDYLSKSLALTNLYPSPFRVWLGHRLYVIICDADLAKAILLNPRAIEKDDVYRFLRPWLGTGLLTAPADKWRVHRKLIQPTFNKRILESFLEIFTTNSELLTVQMEKELSNGEFDIFEYLSLCTLDIICETAMGVTVEAQTGKDTRYIVSAKRGLEIIYTRMLKLWLHPNFIFNLTMLGKNQKMYLKHFHEVPDNVIQKKKSAYKNGTRVENKIDEPEQGKTKKVFLDLLLEISNDGTKLTDEELRDEVVTMIIAATDTTASVNSFVMLMLASFPEVQERVYQELCEIYGEEISSKTPVKNEDLSRMEYMERVIKETMRLFPIGQIIARHITEDIKLGDRTLPKGSGAVVAIFKLHRSEKYWTDPLKFDPDRFLPEEVAKRHPYCYLPFSAGPRNCIGMNYAMMAMKALLATVLRRYVLKKDKFVAIEDIQLKADLLLKPLEPITIGIVKRTITPNININSPAI